MTVYIGVDFHARQPTISYLTTEEGEIKRLQLDHAQPEEIRRFYGQFAGQRVVVGFESSGRAAWFEELLEELGCEIWIGHATDRKSTRLNSSHQIISYAVFCLKKKIHQSS